MSIHYIKSNSEYLGHTIIAFQSNQICYFGFGKSIDNLKLHFPSIHNFIKSTNSDHQQIIKNINSKSSNFKELDKYIKNQLRKKILFSGTEFEKTVLKCLFDVGHGKTISYSDLAKMIGNKKSYRACANVCAKNKIALLIPCHRVINKNGNIGGYGYGIEKKIQLLKLENVNIKRNQNDKTIVVINNNKNNQKKRKRNDTNTSDSVPSRKKIK